MDKESNFGNITQQRSLLTFDVNDLVDKGRHTTRLLVFYKKHYF